MSRVIKSLGEAKKTHINFRDSKLTRILQPALSGNARMAIICCATSSELFLNETLSTLQFATRAKMVKTNAQVNEVMDDRSMIKKLQRELAAAKRAADGIADIDQVRVLESEAAREKDIAKKAQEKYEKLKTSILKGGMFQGDLSKNRKRISSERTPLKGSILELASPSVRGMDIKRRRQSDGIVQKYYPFGSPLLDSTNRQNALTTMTPTLENKKEAITPVKNSVSFQISVLKKALVAKGDIARDREEKLNEWQDKAEKFEDSLRTAFSELDTLKEDKDASAAKNEALEAEKEALELERKRIMEEMEAKLSEKEDAIIEALSKIEQTLHDKEELESIISELQTENENKDEAYNLTQQEKKEAIEILETENKSMSEKQADLEKQCAEYQVTLAMKEAALDACEKALKEYEQESYVQSNELTQSREIYESLIQEKEALTSQVQEISDTVSSLEIKLSEKENEIVELAQNVELSTQIAKKMSEKEDNLLEENCELQNKIDEYEESSLEMRNKFNEVEAQLHETKSQKDDMELEIQALKSTNESLSTSMSLGDEVKNQIVSSVADLADSLTKGVTLEIDSLPSELHVLVNSLNELQASRLAQLRELETQLEESLASQSDLLSQNKELKEELEEKDSLYHTLEEEFFEVEAKLESSTEKVEQLEAEISTKNHQIESLNNELLLSKNIADEMSKAEDAALSTVNELNAKIELMESNMDSNTKTMKQELETVNLVRNELQETVSSLEEKLEKAQNLTHALKEELVVGKDTIESLHTEKDLAEALASEMSTNEDSAIRKVEQLTKNVVNLQQQLSEMDNERDVVLSTKENLETQINVLCNKILLLQDQVSDENDASNALVTEKENLEEQLQDACDVVTSIQQRLHEESEANNALVTEKEELEEHLQETCETLSKLEEAFNASKDTIAALAKEKELAEAIASKMSSTEDSAIAKIDQLMKTITDLKSQVTEKENHCTSLESEKENLEIQVNDLCSRIIILQQQVLDESDASSTLVTEKENIEEQLQDACDTLTSIQQHLQEEIEVTSALVAEKEELEDQLQESREESHLLKKQLENSQNDLVELNSALNDEVTVLQSKCNTLKEAAEAKDVTIQTLDEEKRLAEELAEKLSNKEDALTSENEALVEAMEESKAACAQLQKTISEMSASANVSETLQSQLAAAEEKCNDLESQVTAFSQDKEASANEYERLKLDYAQQIQNLNDEICDLNIKLEKCTEDVAEMTTKFTIESQKLCDANVEIQTLQVELTKLREQDESVSDKSTEDNQVQELQKLLALANEREGEAKKIALASDEELDRKEKEYEEAILYATECEAAMKEYEQKCIAFERSGGTDSSQGTEEILNEMEMLLDEKAELERQLENALLDVRKIEDSLNTKHEEEQTKLLQEADSMMNDLKKQLAEKESEVEKLKTESRLVREDFVKLEEQFKSRESNSVSSDGQIQKLSDELLSSKETIDRLNTQLQEQKEDFEAFKDHVKFTKESLKKAAEEKMSQAKDEISSLQQSSHEDTMKVRSLQEKLDLAENEIQRLETDLKHTKHSLVTESDRIISNLKEENALLRVDLSRAQTDVCSLTEDVDMYKASLKKAKHDSANNEQMNELQCLIAEKEELLKEKDQQLVASKHHYSNLQEEMENLKSTLKSKDARIEGLEQKKLTKAQVQGIQKLKEDKKKYQTEVKELKTKLQQLSENGQQSEPVFDNEKLTKLEVDLEKTKSELERAQVRSKALEKKLHKHLKYKDAKEKEISAIEEMIQATVTDIEGNDVNAAVVALCDRFTTLEEECADIAEAKKSIETALSKTKQQLEDTFAQQRETEAELQSTKDEFKTLSKRCKDYKKVSEEMKGSSTALKEDMIRQKSYYEKEMLALVDENKGLKGELRSQKIQNKVGSGSSSTNIDIDDEATADLGSLLALQDKENIGNSRRVTRSSARLQKTKQPRVGLGAGEGAGEDDNTQECQQS